MPLPEGYMLGIDEVIKDLDGDPHPEGMTLYDVMKAALTNLVNGEEKMDGDKRFDLYLIAAKLKAIKDRKPDAEELELGDLSTIKDRVGAAFHPNLVGPVWLFLDPALRNRKTDEKSKSRKK